MQLAEQLRTTTFLITLRYMVLFFVSVTILIGFVNWSLSRYAEREIDRDVAIDVSRLAKITSIRGVRVMIEAIQVRSTAELQGDNLYLVANANFQPIAGNLGAWPELSPKEDGVVTFEHTTPDGRTVPARGRVFIPDPNARVLVALKSRAVEQLSILFDRALFWGLGITLALSLVGGLLMSDDVLRRVNEINRTTRRIMKGDLTQRIATRGTRDEFDELGDSLNAMLDQIETLMISMQHISDNIAHDLRTPLTRLRNRLEKLLQISDPDQAENIGSCIDDADKLLSTFASLMSIARIESGSYEANVQEFSLADLIRDACELYQAVAEERSITLDTNFASSSTIAGDRNLIFQAITNLLDNAIKYTHSGGRVEVSLTNGDGIVLRVSDNGPGIPPDMREKVLQRFFRLDKSRTKPGSGLGLSLVNAIAIRHRARLVLKDNNPGLTVEMVFEPQQAAAAHT